MASKKNNKQKKPVACKVCSHAHRLEIETALIIDCKSSREVERMIKKNKWEEVSYVTLLKHIQEHVDEKRQLILHYLEDKRKIIEAQGEILDIGDDPEVDGQAVMLNALKHLDASIAESSVLVQQSSKAIREQLSLRVETEAEAKGKKPGTKVVGVDRKKADKNKAYVPLQSVLVNLFKVASEEQRQTIKAKIEILGIDSDGKNAKSMETLVDLVMANHSKDSQ